MRVSFVRAAVVVALLSVATSARSDNNFSLERLIGPPSAPGQVNDPSSFIVQSQFRSLMSEMGVVLAPRFLSPADTLGWSGFQLSLESSFTQISNHADYWKLGVRHVSGSYLPTISVMARKGIWFPLPSFELGAGGTYLIDSDLYALTVYAKFGLHEGFHKSVLPSLAVRGAVSHLFGSSQVDMTVVSVDVSISKSFGLGGMMKLDPYVGANALFTIVRSQVIDTTPMIDAYQQGPNGLDLNANTTFPDQDTIIRWRLFGGFRLVYWKLAITGEVDYVLCNDSGSNCGKDNPAKITDRSNGQLQLSLSGSLYF
jgi:hypothetical protein